MSAAGWTTAVLAVVALLELAFFLRYLRPVRVHHVVLPERFYRELCGLAALRETSTSELVREMLRRGYASVLDEVSAPRVPQFPGGVASW